MGKELEKSEEEETFDLFIKELRNFDLRKKPSNHFKDMTRTELLMYIQNQHDELRKISDLLIELKWYADLFEIRSAKSIMKHWETFNDFMDENEEFKEEWDALCMAIRLKDE